MEAEELEFLPSDDLGERADSEPETEAAAIHVGAAGPGDEELNEADLVDTERLEKLELGDEPEEEPAVFEATEEMEGLGQSVEGEVEALAAEDIEELSDREQDLQEIIALQYHLEEESESALESMLAERADLAELRKLGGDFVCGGCLLRRLRTQLADPERLLCVDCVENGRVSGAATA